MNVRPLFAEPPSPPHSYIIYEPIMRIVDPAGQVAAETVQEDAAAIEQPKLIVAPPQQEEWIPQPG